MFIAGCSQVPSAYKKNKDLFKLCRFNDLNKSGAIEKPAKANNWNENYVPEADIDKDETITESEAKYYLLKLDNVNQEEKNKFPLTEKDKENIVSMLKTLAGKAEILIETSELCMGKIKQEYIESEAFRIAGILANAASETTKAIKIAGIKINKNDVIEELKRALRFSSYIKDPEEKDYLRRQIKSELIETGMNKSEIKNIFNEAGMKYQ